MIISTNWLAEYVSLSVSADALVERLLLSGLNHESTRTIGADTAIEIEVTRRSNESALAKVVKMVSTAQMK